MPSLRLFLARLFPRILGTTQQQYVKTSSDNTHSNARATNGQHKSRVSQLERGQHTGEGGEGIRYQEPYTIDYEPGDHDEVELMVVRDLDLKSAKSGRSDET